MQRIDVLERKLKTAKDLQSIVKTMKGLAAVSISQYEHAVDSITQYFLTIEQGLQVVLQKHPHIPSFLRAPQIKESPKRIAVVFGAGQPLCGSFNEVLATFFDRRWQDMSRDNEYKIIAIGHRLTANLERYNRTVDHLFEMPTTIEQINETVQSLVLSIQQWNVKEGYSEAYLFYNTPEANAGYMPVMQQLLPVNLHWLKSLTEKDWERRSIPTYTMDTEALLSALIQQLLFVSTYKAFSESLSAENNSRLAAMQLAEKRITDMIEDLTQSYRNQRQVDITDEILAIMASYEVLKEVDNGGY